MSNEDLIKMFVKNIAENESFQEILARLMAIYHRLKEKIGTEDEFGMDPKLLEITRPLFDFLYAKWWRVDVNGVKNIPSKGPAIIVANHSGMLPFDAVMLNMGVFKKHPKKRNVRFLVADFVDNFPFVSQFIQRSGGVKATPENAEKLLKKGEVICVFPEGTKGIGKLHKDKYKLESFGKGGVVKLAQKTGAQIIPTAIIGAEDIYPILWKSEEMGKRLGLPYLPVTPTFPLFGLVGLIPFPSKWSINFGAPIKIKKSEKNITQANSDLRATIQQMIDDSL